MLLQDSTLQLSECAGYFNDGLNGFSIDKSLITLARSGYLALGLSSSLGGSGGSLSDVVEAIASVSEQCLTSGFVFWCQRAFIEYLSASGNHYLQSEILPMVLKGELSGATGLSNAMKYLAGIEKLRLQVEIDNENVTVNGFLPWASNLRPEKFVIAVAGQTDCGKSMVIAVPADISGLNRGEDLQLLGLQASWTSSLKFNNVQLCHSWIISDNGAEFLPKIRPAFLLMQCGLALGMARRSLEETRQSINTSNQEVLASRLGASTATLSNLENHISYLSTLSAFNLAQMRQLFEVRVKLTRLAVEVVQMELEAKGGTGYLKPSGTARRLREVAFLPVLTPSLVQLETELYRHRLVKERSDVLPYNHH